MNYSVFLNKGMVANIPNQNNRNETHDVITDWPKQFIQFVGVIAEHNLTLLIAIYSVKETFGGESFWGL